MRINLTSLALAILSELAIHSFAWPLLGSRPNQDVTDASHFQKRSENTCADPSLARTVYEAFAAQGALHTLNFHFIFVHLTTLLDTAIPTWTVQGPIFRAWPTQQEFVVPLFVLSNSDGTDEIYMIGEDANTPPTVSGFGLPGSVPVLLAYVYSTQVCGSVPLMSAELVHMTDHYYTIDPDEHAGLLKNGWVDSGVVAFVLPLTSS